MMINACTYLIDPPSSPSSSFSPPYHSLSFSQWLLGENRNRSIAFGDVREKRCWFVSICLPSNRSVCISCWCLQFSQQLYVGGAQKTFHEEGRNLMNGGASGRKRRGPPVCC
mmetsp:Transcript_1849/g.3850  ORF Transcript_1849/g.3850 Transcript_1849/m.3850 type:complete len:112 (-) Transcript_1849:67-402(-)